jgi:hypothetical protein
VFEVGRAEPTASPHLAQNGLHASGWTPRRLVGSAHDEIGFLRAASNRLRLNSLSLNRHTPGVDTNAPVARHLHLLHDRRDVPVDDVTGDGDLGDDAEHRQAVDLQNRPTATALLSLGELGTETPDRARRHARRPTELVQRSHVARWYPFVHVRKHGAWAERMQVLNRPRRG